MQMTGTLDPWHDIGIPREANTLITRLADDQHTFDYWFARDLYGRYVFCFDTNANVPAKSSIPKLAGIEAHTVAFGVSDCRLVLTLVDTEQFDIFRPLCFDLMRATTNLSKSENGKGLTITLNRLQRWQSLLERVRNKLLTDSKIIGLVGELLVLRDLFMSRMDGFNAVKSWRGPYGDEQDFLLSNRIIEVKTQLSTSDRNLLINSEEQLDTSSGPILICHQTLDVTGDENNGAKSLNGLVTSLDEDLAASDFSAADLFATALLETGYRQHEEYEKPFWLLNSRTYYEVREGFPRVIPDMLSVGINRVRYRISVGACKDFEICKEEAMDWVFRD